MGVFTGCGGGFTGRGGGFTGRGGIFTGPRPETRGTFMMTCFYRYRVLGQLPETSKACRTGTRG
eukprot:703191-Pyramimonas_sp.AAC.1